MYVTGDRETCTVTRDKHTPTSHATSFRNQRGSSLHNLQPTPTVPYPWTQLPVNIFNHSFSKWHPTHNKNHHYQSQLRPTEEVRLLNERLEEKSLLEVGGFSRLWLTDAANDPKPTIGASDWL